jgi:short-subunit dehydrogenase involved in D-alanine esterification of teichoic acids
MTVYTCALQFVKQFVERGNLVFATVRSTSAASKLKDLGENVTVIIMDVTDSDSIEKFAKTIRDETDHVDVSSVIDTKHNPSRYSREIYCRDHTQYGSIHL